MASEQMKDLMADTMREAYKDGSLGRRLSDAASSALLLLDDAITELEAKMDEALRVRDKAIEWLVDRDVMPSGFEDYVAWGLASDELRAEVWRTALAQREATDANR